jgi:hypothetical protein
MAMGIQLLPGILQVENQPVEIVKIGAEINKHVTNDDLYTLYVAYGWKKMNKRYRKGGLKEVNVPRSHVVRVPNDFEPNGLMTMTPKVICTVAHMCQEAKVWEIDRLNKELNKSNSKRDEAIQTLWNFMNAIQSTGTHSEKVLAVQSEYAELMKKIGLMEDVKKD